VSGAGKARKAGARRRSGRNADSKIGKKFNQAFLFAARMHACQKKKGTDVPYLAHLMGVASLVLEAGGDEELAIAALLHDVVEDCGGIPMLKEVRRRFGKKVAHIVDGCTDAYATPKPPWRERKEQYIHRLRDEDDEVRLVSAADKLYNLRSILADYRELGEPFWERFNGKREGTLWYYRALNDEFLRKDPNRITSELARVLAQLEDLAGSSVTADPVENSSRKDVKLWRA
jgi:(p)ppGpp synthase/HD superfamily hydrolase